MTTNYDNLKHNIVTLYDGIYNKMFTVEELVKYLNQSPQPPQILDKVEKRYIRNVVAPFWRKVKYVVKRTDGANNFIDIAYTEIPQYAYDRTTHLSFPSFDTDSEMYVNMEMNKHYTLEELDIKFE